jgi:3-dehydroquinate synthase
MTTPKSSEVSVDLGSKSYDIVIGHGLVAEAGERIGAVLARPRTVIITDKTVNDLHAGGLEESLARAGVDHDKIILPPGEKTKSLHHTERLLDDLLEMGVERNESLVAMGGGVIGDLAGFTAAVLRRGIDFVQIPTTLLAQVDSSVGGKTGVNTAQGKNLVGAFHQPRLVLADVALLDTLPEREFLAGYAETVKYGLIDDANFFSWLENNVNAVRNGDPGARQHVVETSCRAKARVVAADERESGVRALLNLGHTFGHALEAMAGYGPDLLHGEAVSIGLVMAFDLSARLGLCPAQDADRVRHHLEEAGLPTGPSEIPSLRQHRSSDDMLRYIAQDKKVADGRFTFILARGIGDVFITQDVDGKALNSLLEESLAA